MQFTLPEQSDWCDNMTLRSYNYAPVLPVRMSRPYFLTRPQDPCNKFGIWGRDYCWTHVQTKVGGERVILIHVIGSVTYNILANILV